MPHRGRIQNVRHLLRMYRHRHWQLLPQVHKR
nr:MAG TPA: hypothetical protein [Caudoviricetes sp.]